MMRWLLALLLVAAVPLPACAAELIVTVTGIRSDRGDVRLSVYASPAEWPDKSTGDHDQVVKAQRRSVTFRFDLPPGVYAVDCFHDENGDGKFNTTLVGWPEEGFCFSNNVQPFLSAPSFDAASFVLPPGGASITVRMIYW